MQESSSTALLGEVIRLEPKLEPKAEMFHCHDDFAKVLVACTQSQKQGSQPQRLRLLIHVCSGAGRPCDVRKGTEEVVLGHYITVASPNGRRSSLRDHLIQAASSLGGSQLIGQHVWIFWFDEEVPRARLKGRWFPSQITGAIGVDVAYTQVMAFSYPFFRQHLSDVF